jgi:hypothetical protein
MIVASGWLKDWSLLVEEASAKAEDDRQSLEIGCFPCP